MAHRAPRIAPLFVTCLVLAVCDGGDGTSGIAQDGGDLPDLGADAASEVQAETTAPDSGDPLDTRPGPDTAAPDDTAPEDAGVDSAAPSDTDVADSASADVGPSDTSEPIEDTSVLDADSADASDTGSTDTTQVCTSECLEVMPGLPGVAITLQALSVSAPTLRGVLGQRAPLGRFELVAIDVYPKGAVPSFVSLRVTDGGDTNGAAELAGDTWGVHLFLDLAVSLSAFGQGFDQAARQELAGGGCYALSGAILESDLSHCASGWPEDVDVPDEAEFEYDDASGSLKMKLELSKEFLLALVPPEYAGLASLGISGPLNLVLGFEAAGPL